MLPCRSNCNIQRVYLYSMCLYFFIIIINIPNIPPMHPMTCSNCKMGAVPESPLTACVLKIPIKATNELRSLEYFDGKDLQMSAWEAHEVELGKTGRHWCDQNILMCFGIFSFSFYLVLLLVLSLILSRILSLSLSQHFYNVYIHVSSVSLIRHYSQLCTLLLSRIIFIHTLPWYMSHTMIKWDQY